MLLSLSGKAERPSEVASENQEYTSDPGPIDKTPGSTSEGPTQAREPVEEPLDLSGASAHPASPSTTPSETGSGGKDGQGNKTPSSKGELRTAQLPWRQRHNEPLEEIGPLEQPSYKYLLVDDNDINLKILASFMKRLGHGYDMASNGLEALQMYTANPGFYPFVLMGKLV